MIFITHNFVSITHNSKYVSPTIEKCVLHHNSVFVSINQFSDFWVMSYGNWKHILGVFSFHNSVFNGISINILTWWPPFSMSCLILQAISFLSFFLSFFFHHFLFFSQATLFSSYENFFFFDVSFFLSLLCTSPFFFFFFFSSSQKFLVFATLHDWVRMGLDLDLGFQNTNMNGFQSAHSMNTVVVSQPRPWTKILQWAGSLSTTFQIRSATSRCLSARHRRIGFVSAHRRRRRQLR